MMQATSGPEQLGDPGRDPAGGLGIYRAVPGLTPDLPGDRLADSLGTGGRVVHPPPGAVAGEPVRDVERLLKVMAEREVDKRPVAGDELHRRGEPALDDGQVACGQ